MDAPLTAPIDKYRTSPFFTDFVEGCLTMDAIAALTYEISEYKSIDYTIFTDVAR